MSGHKCTEIDQRSSMRVWVQGCLTSIFVALCALGLLSSPVGQMEQPTHAVAHATTPSYAYDGIANSAQQTHRSCRSDDASDLSISRRDAGGHTYDAFTNGAHLTHRGEAPDDAVNPSISGLNVADTAKPFSFSLDVVATKTAGQADHLIPIGPGSQKAWNVLDWVLDKGASLPGYKGGRVFENRGTGMKLPESGPGGEISYREWDVDPFTKGVDRGTERLVTGSDGSAYYTGDHYDTFVRIR